MAWNANTESGKESSAAAGRKAASAARGRKVRRNSKSDLLIIFLLFTFTKLHTIRIDTHAHTLKTREREIGR